MTKRRLYPITLWIVLLLALTLSQIAYAAPSYSSLNQNGTQVNSSSSLMLSTFWNSTTQITSAVLSTNETGLWANYTVPSFYIEQQIPILTYHQVNDTNPTNVTPLVLTSDFKKQMDYLYYNGYTTITFSELLNFTNNYKLFNPKKLVVITFDDGWKNQYTNAYPIMRARGFVGTFFIITNVTLFNGTDRLYSNRMSMADVRDLYNNGNEIGSHTKTHVNLTSPTVNYTQELNDSYSDIYKIIGVYPISIAYPNGDYNSTVGSWALSVGFKLGRLAQKPGATTGQRDSRTGVLNSLRSATMVPSPPIQRFTTFIGNISGDDFVKDVNFSGRSEFEDMVTVVRDDNSNMGTGAATNISYQYWSVYDKNDTVFINLTIPKSAGYNLTFKVRTGTVADNPYILAHLLNYIIDGNTYVGNSSRAPTINNSQYYFVNCSSNLVMGFQQISNIYLKEGYHNLTIQHNSNGSSMIGLDYFLVNYNDTIINPSSYYNSPMYLRGYSGWSNFTWKNGNIPTNTVVGWSIYSSDASNQWGVTPVQTFIANYVLGNTTNTTNSTNITNQTFTEFDPLWTLNYTMFNASWSSTFNYTYDQAANRNMTEAVLAVINQPGVVNFTCIVNDTGMSVDLNRVWINTLGGGNITPGTITPNLLSPDFALSSSRITWDSNIQAASGQSMSGYIMKPYSGIIEPFECNAGSEGWMFYNTSSHTLMLCDGITWRSVILG